MLSKNTSSAAYKNQPLRQLSTLLLFSFLGFISFVGAISVIAAPLTIATQGKSTYSLVVPEIAAASVNDAAAEMQRSIQDATGAQLAIIKGNEAAIGPFISLSSTQQAKAAGITAEGIADSGFRIVTKGGNPYIIGLDTTTVSLKQKSGSPAATDAEGGQVETHPEIPGPAYTKTNGFSNSTASGVYTFLENRLGVRRLMPGDLGRDVPVRSTFEIAEMDRTEAPAFISRRMTGMQNGATIGQWRVRQKLGHSFQISQGHNWVQTVPLAMYDEHPDWFAMNSAGERPRPKEGNHYYKLESTNPAGVQYFAKTAIEKLKANPHLNTFSLSPSDDWNWSQSPKSKALYDPPAPGTKVPSVTPLVLKFYHDVAAIVAREYSQGRVSGYIYSNFAYPPQQGGMKLPENFTPIITGQGSGYRFYDPEIRKTASHLVGSWEKVAPSIWFYYCLVFQRARSDCGRSTLSANERSTLNGTFAAGKRHRRFTGEHGVVGEFFTTRQSRFRLRSARPR